MTQEMARSLGKVDKNDFFLQDAIKNLPTNTEIRRK